MNERGEIDEDVREIQGFREWVRDADDAGRRSPARDAGIAPQRRRRMSWLPLEMVDKQERFQ